MRLKRWESPRREGRNDKGRGGSARKRQLKKQRQMLLKKLKQADKGKDNNNYPQGEEKKSSPFFMGIIPTLPIAPPSLGCNFICRVESITLQ
ncbi:hypothetical protein VB620_05715 [Nodularia harveyana UHCC-0300]|uniref:Uncharacterized protein n=1 Tax=Nodularia harveyana UHCC-0300 TaxID=2974287 RepID=A0ABU5UCX2_9CYAN|nr:hypothetical protein [Nodularia harveyana]MEA5580836.1 hypothetical protein [Nodularia harveyana UHCC-0300]